MRRGRRADGGWGPARLPGLSDGRKAGGGSGTASPAEGGQAAGAGAAGAGEGAWTLRGPHSPGQEHRGASPGAPPSGAPSPTRMGTAGPVSSQQPSGEPTTHPPPPRVQRAQERQSGRRAKSAAIRKATGRMACEYT